MTKRRSRRASVVGALALVVLLPLGWLLAHLPVPAGLWMGRRLGDLAWALLRRRRAMTCRNLARAFGGECSSDELRRLGRRSFQHLGMNVVEACVSSFRPMSALLSRVDITGLEHLDQADAEGRGILILGAHLGNWELLAASHALTRFRLSVVVRPLDDPVLDRVVERLRRRSGAEVIAKRRALGEIQAALRRGHMVGILLDQNAARAESVFAPFFGAPASTSKALALISLRTGAPVVPVFPRRLRGGRHLVEIHPPVPRPAGAEVTEYTAAFNRAIEAAVRRAPEQWFWMHDRWRTRPRVEAT